MWLGLLNLVGGIKTLIFGAGAAILGIYIYWLKGSRDSYKAETQEWRKVEEVRKHDAQVDKAIAVEIDRVDATPDAGLDDELDRVCQYADAKNAAGE